VRRPSRLPHILSVVQQYLNVFFGFVLNCTCESLHISGDPHITGQCDCTSWSSQRSFLSIVRSLHLNLPLVPSILNVYLLSCKSQYSQLLLHTSETPLNAHFVLSRLITLQVVVFFLDPVSYLKLSPPSSHLSVPQVSHVLGQCSPTPSLSHLFFGSSFTHVQDLYPLFLSN